MNTAREGLLASRTLRRFTRKEDGTVTIFGVMMFILMVAVGGIAIDIMRYETQRVQLQYTLDRAVLAAAALDQELDPRAVVEDYFATSGLEGYRLRMDVDDTDTFRTVQASAEMDLNTNFLHMFGIRALTAPAFGRAEERVPNSEIVLVLDTSGSMRELMSDENNDDSVGTRKLAALQTAANLFLADVMRHNDTSDRNRVSVSLVPYASTVNAGATLDSVFNITSDHDYSACTRWMPDQFNSLSLGSTEQIQRLGHFDYYFRDQAGALFTLSHCLQENNNAIVPWSANFGQLEGAINNLEAEGWTAIDQGMRWAAALLDPSARDELSALASTAVPTDTTTPSTDPFTPCGSAVNHILDVYAGLGSGSAATETSVEGEGTASAGGSTSTGASSSSTTVVSSDFVGRPAAYSDEDTLKIVVLMTDGQNTDQYDIAPEYRGFSSIYLHPDDCVWSMYVPETGQYFIPALKPDGSNDFYNPTGTLEAEPHGGFAVYDPEVFDMDASHALTWEYLLATYTQHSIAHGFYSGAIQAIAANGYVWADGEVSTYQSIREDSFVLISGNDVGSFDADPYPQERAETADDNLEAICDALKDPDGDPTSNDGVIIYTIAFEAPEHGRTTMQYCATSASTYYNVSGDEDDWDIEEAFAAIATSIERLRLTQ